MRDTRVALFVHQVWGTWDRLPLLTGEVDRDVYRCLHDTCAEMSAEALALGGVEDHLHLLVRIPATLAVADLVKHLKGASSHLVTHRIAPDMLFKWPGGYGAFSCGLKQVPVVKDYILRQKEHHRLGTLVPAYEPGPACAMVPARNS